MALVTEYCRRGECATCARQGSPACGHLCHTLPPDAFTHPIAPASPIADARPVPGSSPAAEIAELNRLEREAGLAQTPRSLRQFLDAEALPPLAPENSRSAPGPGLPGKERS